MRHDEVFGSSPPLFADPVPGCRGELAGLFGDWVILADEGWTRKRQEIHRCRACGVRIGLLDGVLKWVERGSAGLPRRTADPRIGAKSGRRTLKGASLVLGILQAHADETGVCTLSNGEIEAEAGLTRRPVQYALRTLESEDLIHIEGGMTALSGRRIVLNDRLEPPSNGVTPT